MLVIKPCDWQEAMFASYKLMANDLLPPMHTEETKSAHKEKPLLADTAGNFVCKYCPMKFKMCSALGGHVSKAHPGLSEAYEHKKRVRDMR